jgi:hypothetical protein
VLNEYFVLMLMLNKYHLDFIFSEEIMCKTMMMMMMMFFVFRALIGEVDEDFDTTVRAAPLPQIRF